MGVQINIVDTNSRLQTTADDSISGIIYIRNFQLLDTIPPIDIEQNQAWYSYKLLLENFDDTAKEAYAEFLFICKAFWDCNPNGVLWISLLTTQTTTPTFDIENFDIETFLNAADGKIRNLALKHSGVLFELNQIGYVNSALEVYASNEFCPSIAFYQADYNSNNPNLRDVGAKRVSFCNSIIVEPITAEEYCALGYMLGTKSLAQVHQSIGFVEGFRLPIAVDTVIKFWDGTNVAFTPQSQLNNYFENGYTFIRNYKDYPGKYINSAPVCNSATSDFAFLENTATMDKAFREVRRALIPAINSSIYSTADGKMTALSLSYLKNKAIKPLQAMLIAREISSYVVEIDPNQNVAATSIVDIVVSIRPVGVAYYINVSLSFQI